MIIGFDYYSECWRLPDKLAYEAETLANEELNLFLDETLPRFGQRKWAHYGHNLVTDQGARWLCDRFSPTAAASTWFVLFKGSGTINAADTGTSHAGWTEMSGFYTQTVRPTLVLASPTSGRSTDNIANLASVSVGASPATIHGFGLINVSTKGSTTGILFGVGDYVTPRSVVAGDQYRAQASVTF